MIIINIDKMHNNKQSEKINWGIIIIGAGQAGLATGYYLKQYDEDFLIIDEGDRIGNSWRKRWDSLRLFTPAQFNGLPGLAFPARKDYCPTKEEVANYLDAYARKFGLPVQLNTKVFYVSKVKSGYEIETSVDTLFCKQVVIASGYYTKPRIPGLANRLDRNIKQLHSSEYTNPHELPNGEVLVVGAGASGVQIAIDVARYRPTIIAGNFTTKIPDFIFKYIGRFYWWFINNILTINTRIGRKAKAGIMKGGGGPLVNVSPKDVEAASIEHVSKITDAKHGKPVLESGRIISPSAIIWCTGFETAFSWLEESATDEKGYPIAKRGISSVMDGLYFVGMMFQYALSSHLIGGVGKDAAFIAKHLHTHSSLQNKSSAKENIKNKKVLLDNLSS